MLKLPSKQRKIFKEKIQHEAYPEEKPYPVSRAGIVVSIFGTIVIVALINLLVGWYLEDRTFNRGYWIVTQKGKVLSSLKKPGYWLIVGDSSGNFGIVPDVLDKHLGIRSINLCTVADMLTMDDFFMVEEYIKRHGSPTGVLIVHAYDSWPREGKLGAFARSHWALNKIGGFLHLDSYALLQLLIKRYFPLYSESTTLASMSLMPKTAFLRRKPPFAIQPDGFMVLPEASSRVEDDARFHLKQIEKIAPEISLPNRLGLQAIADLADHHQFNVYLANSPMYDGLWHHAGFRSYFNVIQGKLKQVADNHPRLHLLHFDSDLRFSANQMENVDHVIFSAAKIYTSRVANGIQMAGWKDTLNHSTRSSKILFSVID